MFMNTESVSHAYLPKLSKLRDGDRFQFVATPGAGKTEDQVCDHNHDRSNFVPWLESRRPHWGPSATSHHEYKHIARCGESIECWRMAGRCCLGDSATMDLAKRPVKSSSSDLTALLEEMRADKERHLVSLTFPLQHISPFFHLSGAATS